MTQGENQLFSELKREQQEHDLTKKELKELELDFKKLRNAFNELLDDYCAKRETYGFNDVDDVRYRFMELSGLLDL